MSTNLPSRTENDETEDLACDFVEQELGKWDWQGNWDILKAADIAEQRIADWLMQVKVTHSAKSIEKFLDHRVANLRGRWS